MWWDAVCRSAVISTIHCSLSLPQWNGTFFFFFFFLLHRQLHSWQTISINTTNRWVGAWYVSEFLTIFSMQMSLSDHWFACKCCLPGKQHIPFCLWLMFFLFCFVFFKARRNSVKKRMSAFIKTNGCWLRTCIDIDRA